MTVRVHSNRKCETATENVKSITALNRVVLNLTLKCIHDLISNRSFQLFPQPTFLQTQNFFYDCIKVKAAFVFLQVKFVSVQSRVTNLESYEKPPTTNTCESFVTFAMGVIFSTKNISIIFSLCQFSAVRNYTFSVAVSYFLSLLKLHNIFQSTHLLHHFYETFTLDTRLFFPFTICCNWPVIGPLFLFNTYTSPLLLRSMIGY